MWVAVASNRVKYSSLIPRSQYGWPFPVLLCFCEARLFSFYLFACLVDADADVASGYGCVAIGCTFCTLSFLFGARQRGKGVTGQRRGDSGHAAVKLFFIPVAGVLVAVLSCRCVKSARGDIPRRV